MPISGRSDQKARPPKDEKRTRLRNEKHFANLLAGYSEAFVTGKFCDVKVVCQDSNLWAHRVVLSTVSPFLKSLLSDFERRGDDVVTIFLPLIKGYHMKLVLDYIYGGAMYLCGAHMQYVIEVMEVLQLKCGVSVNKMVCNEGDTNKQWVEVEHTTMKLKSKMSPVVSESKKPGQPSSRGRSESNKPSEADLAGQNQSGGSKEQPIATSTEDGPLDSSLEENEDCVEVEAGEETEPEKGSSSSSEESEEETEQMADGRDLEGPVPDKALGDKEEVGEEEDDDMVMVEVDEAFVVKPLSGGGDQADARPKHKCILCGRVFRFYENLQVHLTGHLGVKVNIIRCHPCRRNFRNQNELNLHKKAHSYARHLGRYRQVKSAEELKNLLPEAKIITTVGTHQKKILRKYVKKDRGTAGLVTRKREQASSTPTTEPLGSEYEGAASVHRSVGRRQPKKLYTVIPKALNFIRSGGSSKTLGKTIVESTILSPRTPTSISRLENPYSKQFNTPRRKLGASSSTGDEFTSSDAGGHSPAIIMPAAIALPSTPPAAKLARKEDSSSGGGTPLSAGRSPTERLNLQCADCDRIFPAKSIFERHLKTAKHGAYSLYSSSSDCGSPLAAATSASPNRRIECHLCGLTFMRVRDLAKHREKVCSAWQNPGK